MLFPRATGRRIKAIKPAPVVRYQIHLYDHSLLSLIFREGNGHLVMDMVWWDIMPEFVRGDFFRDRSTLPNFHFPIFLFLFEGLVWPPPLVHIFPFFFYIFNI